MRALWAFVIAVAAIGDVYAFPVDPPVARYAPKGRPPGRTGASTTHTGWFDAGEYLYVAYGEGVGTHTAGAGGTIAQADPALGIGDFHSLAEIAVESADGRQIVEIGWSVDRLVNGDVQPHVFAYHWVDGVLTCYNACGWVQVSPHKRPGMRVTPGQPHRYEIQLVHDDWWLFYDGEAMGYYPQALWNGRFKGAGLVQWFGEVSAAVPSPCTQMGNGKLGADAGATSFDDLHLFDPDGTAVPGTASMGTVTNAAFYNSGRATPTSFDFGGPGAGAAAGCCTPSTCAAAQAECGSIDDSLCMANTLDCGSCNGTDVCTADHTCPGGIGPRDDGAAFEGPSGEGSGGCCDAGTHGAGSLVLAALVVVRLARRRAFWRRLRGASPHAVE